MNEKFYILIRNIIIALSIGCIFYVYSGNSNKEAKYYRWKRYGYDDKIEISKYLFETNSKENSNTYFKVELFNKDKALQSGLVYFGVSFLILSVFSQLSNKNTLFNNLRFNFLNKTRRRNI